jgi:hypothetical protein
MKIYSKKHITGRGESVGSTGNERPERSKRTPSDRIVSVAVAAIMVCMLAVPVSPSAVRAGGGHEVWTVVAVGDMTGTHLPGNNPQRHQYDDVADLIEDINPCAWLALGDQQHEDGLLEDYMTYYDSEFGRLMDITYPIPGNHDYYWDGMPENNFHSASNGSGYFTYFESRLAEISKDSNTLKYGYYSFDLGHSWHIVALNSVLVFDYDYTVEGTPANLQFTWLENDLKEHSKIDGTIVFLHHPLYDWETPNSPRWASPELQPLWELFYSYGVDIVLNGHSHTYQRWAPQDAYGNYETNGVREFIVGTGGYYLNNLGHPPVPANYVTGQDKEFGALKLTLSDGSYSFEFIGLSGKVFDSGTFACN